MSAFKDELRGFGCPMTAEELARLKDMRKARRKPPLDSSPAVRFLLYGKAKEGYWTFEHFRLQVDDILDMYECLYPGAQVHGRRARPMSTRLAHRHLRRCARRHRARYSHSPVCALDTGGDRGRLVVGALGTPGWRAQYQHDEHQERRHAVGAAPVQDDGELPQTRGAAEARRVPRGRPAAQV